MTYSIVALDPATGDLGVAVQSKFLAVGAVVPWARAGVGAVATQSFANAAYGPDGLDLLAGGLDGRGRPGEPRGRRRLREERQAGIVDAQRRRGDPHGQRVLRVGRRADRRRLRGPGQHPGRGRASSTASPTRSSPVAGPSRSSSWTAWPPPMRPVAIGAVGSRPRSLVVRAGGGYGGGNDRWMDLRVDHHDDPIGELGRLVDLQHLYFDRPAIAELQALDEVTAGEIRAHPRSAGCRHRADAAQAVYAPMSGGAGRRGDEPRPIDRRASSARPRTGTPDWQRALEDWMAVENLEERAAGTRLDRSARAGACSSERRR